MGIFISFLLMFSLKAMAVDNCPYYNPVKGPQDLQRFGVDVLRQTEIQAASNPAEFCK